MPGNKNDEFKAMVHQLVQEDAKPTTILKNGKFASKIAYKFIFKRAFLDYNKKRKIKKKNATKCICPSFDIVETK